jgi:hypothetical protein
MTPVLRSVALAVAGVILVAGCAARRQLASPIITSQPLLSRAVEPAGTAEAAERVKDAIKSLGRQLKRRSGKSPRALANLEPIPLIPLSTPERVVGTSGVWSVLETTRAAAEKQEPFAQTQTRSGEARGAPRTFLNKRTLLIAGAAVLLGLIVVGRLQSSKTPIEHT